MSELQGRDFFIMEERYHKARREGNMEELTKILKEAPSLYGDTIEAIFKRQFNRMKSAH